ncbi:2Fe-2S iron-sulfur cluster binding domain-containing protein, partial [Candidatus Poribacteria bacterium]|nr:2Fe-2S iron-sulfur cluster binding domain-containing protein [Candidatus Poribacteria bacterium]
MATTPAVDVTPSISLFIDGRDVAVPADATVLDAARSAGANVPTLCHSDRLEPHGACRTCLVEQSDGRLVAACHTPAADGESYTTRSERLTRLRKNIVELIVSDHPLDCLTCAASGRCDLQSLAQEVGLRESRYESPRVHTPPRDDSHPFIKLDMEKCIGCGKCVRACDE